MSRYFALGLAAAAMLSGTAASASYDSAKNDYDQGHVAAARAGFRSVLGDPGASAEDRAKAGRGLARIDWLVDGDWRAAASVLRLAPRTGAQACPSRQLLARILREAGQARSAVETTRNLEACTNAGQRDALLRERAVAGLDLAVRAHGPARGRWLAATAQAIAALSPISGLDPRANTIRLELALARLDAPAAFAAWRAYFWLAGAAEAPPALDGPGSERAAFEAALAPGAGLNAAGPMLNLLVRAGFARPVETFASVSGGSLAGARDPLLRKAAIYLAFRHSFEAITLSTYRRLAAIGQSGDPRNNAVAQQLRDDLARLSQQTADRLRAFLPADPAAAPPAYVMDIFNLGATVGSTGGFPSVHIGHIVSDERRAVTQYGQSADLRFTIWDNLLSNGFESWLWDGAMSTGGFSRTGSITQMRPSYLESAIEDAALALDPARRREAAAEMATLSRDDVALARQGEQAGHPVHLPGLARRLRLQALDQLRDEVPGTGSPQDRLLDFAHRDFEATVAHSIWIHEGRHALDHASGAALASDVLEYRAKLAEILLGHFPRMAFAGIDNSLVGESSPHGLANSRILEGYARWIGAHRSEIAGYDPTLPALVQLDRLSDAQLRTVAAGLADFAVPR